MLPLRFIGPQRLSRASAAVTQPAHNCTAPSHRPSATSATAGQSLRPQYLPTFGLRILVQVLPESAS
jgi:hypothetical protein